MEINSDARGSQLELRFREQLRAAVRSTGGAGTVSSGFHGRMPNLGVICEHRSRNVWIQGGGRGSTSKATIPACNGEDWARSSLYSRRAVSAWAELIRRMRRLQGLGKEGSSSLAASGGSLNFPLN